MLPQFTPMPLQRRKTAFDHPDWLFELKYDGFRALAYAEATGCRLVSRNAHAFGSFELLREDIGRALRRSRAVIDGEIVCLDEKGHPQFYNLLYRRTEPCFVAFDLLWHHGEDLSFLPLHERKHRLRALVRQTESRMLYADHVDGNGTALFERACQLDLEGIVAKDRYAPYTADRESSTWHKIRNSRYSQTVGRAEHFERERHSEPVPGWHACELACVQ
jgi:bifunctional non-homologous end joining protein LigD